MTQIQERITICIAKIIQQYPEFKNIFDEIYQQGGRVLLVGGAVRDCLLGCLSSDLDFEVYHLSFEELQAILEKFGKVSFVGKSFGVLRLHKFDVDWSIPRSDSFGRKPNVQLNPDMNFIQAFRRRDVTINSMGIDVVSLELIDPYDGVSDLQQKILRSADITFFVQDPLRLFRVMQFVARFDMKVDAMLNNACAHMDISGVSKERIEQELTKLFIKAYQPSKGFLWLQQIGRLSDIFPHVDFSVDLYRGLDLIASQNNFSAEQKIIASFALLAFSLQEIKQQQVLVSQKITAEQWSIVLQFLKKYTDSSDLITKAGLLAWYLKYVPIMVQKQKSLTYKWLASWIDPYVNIQFLSEVASCWYSPEIVESFVVEAKTAKVLHHAELALVSGQDLIHLVQGKELGELLKMAYKIQIDESIHDKQKLLKKILNNKDIQ